MPDPVPVARPARLPPPFPDQNTITNICASNIILDVPQVTTRSRTGANKPLAPGLPTTVTQTSIQTPSPTITKIIISKHMLQSGAQIHQIPNSMVTVLPAGVRALQPAALATLTSSSRLPPPLQQMQHAPPPRLQQMVHSPAPPPLQAKPRGGAGQGLPVSVTTTAPPPLQIKIVPAALQGNTAVPIVVNTATSANLVGTSTVPTSVYSTPTVAVQVVKPNDTTDEEADAEEFTPGEVRKKVSSQVVTVSLDEHG